MNLRLLAIVVEISDCRKRKNKNKTCLMTSIPVCKKLELMPTFPCARHEERTELKKPKGNIVAKEVVNFLNKEKTYKAVSIFTR